jgi:CheY-like chemotaxis protein
LAVSHESHPSGASGRLRRQPRRHGVPRVLVLQEDRALVRLVRESLLHDDLNATVEHIATPGEAKLRLGRAAAGDAPDLIIIGYELHFRGGLEMLRFLKYDPRYLHIPTVVLALSGSPADLQRCKAMGAEACIDAPTGFDDYVEVVATLRALLALGDEDSDRPA